jgi:3-isopropylmalate/(R)-2-methylmalate dehydratase large subunit
VGLGDIRQGIVHVIGPELGLTQPGMTIACGDSHTVHARRLRVGGLRHRHLTGPRRPGLAVPGAGAAQGAADPRDRHAAKGVYAKDVILAIIQRLGVQGGNGYAYEYAGDAVDRMSMDERMTICNMSIEGRRARRLREPGRHHGGVRTWPPFAPAAGDFDRMATWWKSMASDANARYDDDVEIKAAELTPIVTWGVNPGSRLAWTTRSGARRRQRSARRLPTR